MPPFNPNDRNARRQYYGLPPLGGPGGRPRGMSVGQWAKQQANAIINARLKAIEEAKALYEDEYKTEAQYEEERGQAGADWLQAQDFAGKINAIWGGAAGDVRGMAAALGGQQAAESDAQAAGMDRSVSGSGQEGTMAVPGAMLGDVTYGTGGELPGAALDYTGKGWASDAAMQPSFAARFSMGKAGDIRREGVKGLQDFFLQMAEIKAGRPELRMQLRSERQQELDAKTDRKRDWYLKLWGIAKQDGDEKKAEYWKRKAYELDVLKEKRYQEQADRKAADYYTDAQGRTVPKGYHYNKNGELVRIPGAGGNGRGPDWGDLQHDIANDLPDLMVEVPGAWGNDSGEEKMPWKQAYNTLWSKYSGLVQNKARLRKLITRLLVENGWVRPSSGQRPADGPGGV